MDAAPPSRTAAERLAERREEVLRRWEARVRAEIPAAQGEPHPVLVDTLPAFLEKLVEALSPDHPRADATSGTTIPHEHGGERVRLTRFRLRDVVREYQLLRDVLLEVLGAERALSEAERRVVVISIDAATSEACAAYALVSETFRERVIMTLAHDLRSPLGAAKAGATLILRRPENPSVPRWAARIDDAVDRMDKMLRTLLDVSRAGSGARLALDLAPCDLVEIVRDVVDALRLAHGDRFVVTGPPEVRGHWSRDALGRAVENLLANALKYGDPVRPVTVAIEAAHGRVVVTVHNEGSYVPPEERGMLFDLFRRHPDAEGGKARGWGLGLALVRAVAEAHGGSAGVESAPGTGTSFRIDVPLDARPFQAAPVTPGAP